jgi:hypothetical protein
MSVLRAFDFPGTEHDVRFDRISPAGFRILAALDNIARDWPYDIELTCGTEGVHKGKEHEKGVAYDLRSHNLDSHEMKHALVRAIIERTRMGMADTPFMVNGRDDEGGWANDRFFAFLEVPGTPNEHIHVQLRQGVTYP